jgi:hypothetical protein
MAGDVRRGDPTVLTAVRPLTWIGDISYGIYLWHWPLLLVAPLLLDAPLGAVQKLVLIAAIIALAAASKRWVEDPIRFAPALSRPPARSFLIPIVGTVVIAAVVGTSLVVMQQRTDVARAAVEASRESGGSIANSPDLPLVPSVADRGSDYGDMYECFDLYHEGVEPCSYGDESADVRVAVVGDSHMSHLIPGILSAAEERGWFVTTFVGMNCDSLTWSACTGGADVFDDLVDGGYDGVVTSSFRMSFTPIEEVDLFWQQLVEAQQVIIPIVDVPWHDASAYACMDESDGDVAAAAACASPRSTALETHADRMQQLSTQHGVDAVDVTDVFCDVERCATVIQNTIVYQDSPSSHLTATMSRALAEPIGRELEAALAR